MAGYDYRAWLQANAKYKKHKYQPFQELGNWLGKASDMTVYGARAANGDRSDNSITTFQNAFSSYDASGYNQWTGFNIQDFTGHEILKLGASQQRTSIATAKGNKPGSYASFLRHHTTSDSVANNAFKITDENAIRKNYDAARAAYVDSAQTIGSSKDGASHYFYAALDAARGIGAHSIFDVDAASAALGFNGDAFQGYKIGSQDASVDEIKGAYDFVQQGIAEGKSLDQTLSDWYGTEIIVGPTKDAKDITGYNYKADKESLAEMQGVLSGVMEVTLPFSIAADPTQLYGEQLETAYRKDPMIRAIYESYGASPVDAQDDGDVRWFDPLTGQSVQTVNTRSAVGFTDIFGSVMKSIALGGLGVALGPSIGASLGLTGSVGSAVGSGIVAGGGTLLQGGDAGDALTSALLTGLGDYASSATSAANEAQAAVDNAIKFSAGSEAIADLTGTANLLADQAALANGIASSASAVNAITNEDYLGALTHGLSAAGMASPKEWVMEKVTGTLDPTGTGLIAGRLDTQPFSEAAWKFSEGLLQGKDAGDAMKSAIRKYVKQGGTLNTGGQFAFNELMPDLPDDAFFAQFDEATLKGLEDAIRTAGSYVDDHILQPVRQAGKAFDDSLQPVFDTITGVVAGVEDALADIDFPELGIDLPNVDIDLPDIPGVDVDLPDIPELGVDIPGVDIDIPDVDIDLPDVDIPDVDIPWEELLKLLVTTGEAKQVIASSSPLQAVTTQFNPKDLTVEYEGRSDILEELLGEDNIDNTIDMIAEAVGVSTDTADEIVALTEERVYGSDRVQDGSSTRSNAIKSFGRGKNSNRIPVRRGVS